VPVAALIMGAAAIDLYFTSAGRTAVAGTELTGIGAFVRTPGNWRLLADLVGIAAGGGLFTVPLYAVLQHVSEPSHRSRVIAGNNIINAVAMVAGTLVAGTLISNGVDVHQMFALCGLATFVVGLISTWILRRVLLQRLVRVVLRLLYRVEVEGLEHAQAALPHAVIAANHTSFLDGILLGAFLPGEPIFAIDTQIAKKWWARPLTLLVN